LDVPEAVGEQEIMLLVEHLLMGVVKVVMREVVLEQQEQ
tara:strand:+ start:582 stop:698 length:117 start_codon:yes stop_codon:yes gene_type:complete